MLLKFAFTLLSFPAVWIGWRFIKTHILHNPLNNIPGPPVSSFLKGNVRNLFNSDAWQFHKDIAAQYGGVVRMKAFMGHDYLYVSDPKAMYRIVVKDQYIYETMAEGIKLMFGDGLLGTQGDRHRKQRKMLNPVFSIAHMREMVPIFWDITRKLQDTLTSKVKDGAKEIDMNHWMTRMALELIGQSGLGYSFDPLTENATPHPYSAAVKQLIPVMTRDRVVRDLTMPFLTKIGTAKFRRWVMDLMPFERITRMRDIINLMHSTSIEILEAKRKALEEGDEAVRRQVARGKDVMSILLKANLEASEEDKLPDDEILSQMSMFTFAGMDTTSNALSRILYLLSTHPDVQEKLRREISQALDGDEDLAYDELESLHYLDAVCRETLRLYPPVSVVTRVATQDIMLPLHNPLKGVDGREITEIYVPKNTNFVISILACNRNADIWGEDVLEWKPERWLSPLPESVKDARVPGVYSNLMTFLGGSRACIGFKFSQLEMKVVLALLLKEFKFAPSEKEIFWAMHGIAVPTVVGGDENVPTLPMNVTLC